MFRTDILGKSRIYWALISIKEIIEKKQKQDESDRYSIILFSEKTFEFNEYVYNFRDLFEFIDKEAELIGKTQLPLDRAMKSIVREKRKIGQKMFRVIIVSDGHIHPTVTNPIKYAKLAKDLGVICDVIRFGKSKLTGNILKRCAEITGGNYNYVTDEDEYYKIINRVAEKKKIKVGTIFDDAKDDGLDSMSENIASPLLKTDDLANDQKAQINFEEMKCSICHSDRCMTCETGFYGCGRFCPSCLKPIHLHCALKWAEAQQSNGNNDQEDFKVLRCPFCYYLLKIPIMVKREVFQSKNNDDNIVRRVRFSDDASDLMTSLCNHPDCGIMFDDTMDTYVYKCDACSSYFHEDCFLNDYKDSGKCPYCKCDSTCKE